MIIFLYGEDTFRSRQKLKKLKEKFLREVDPSGTSLTMLDGENIKMEQISESIGPGSLLAKKRMIIIEDLFANKDQVIFGQILDYLKSKKSDDMPADSADNIIIFWDSCVKTKKIKNKEKILKIDSAGREKDLIKPSIKLFEFLTRQKYAQQFKILSNTEATNWIKKEVESRGGKITYRATQTLISLVGSDLWRINNEINKLLSYKLGQEPKLIKTKQTLPDTRNYPTEQVVTIEVEDVELLVRGSFDENIFALTDAISNKNKALAVKLLEEQIEAGLAGSYLITMMVRQFRILLQIKQALDLGLTSRKIINLLKLHPFIVQKGINQVSKFNLPVLKNIFGQLVKIDYKAKTGQADAKTMLNLLVAKM